LQAKIGGSSCSKNANLKILKFKKNELSNFLNVHLKEGGNTKNEKGNSS
jgi:hypothetical protein